MELDIVGLKLHYYIGQKINGKNCKFVYYDEELIKYIICLKDKDDTKYELELYEDYGECYSGWTIAQWGYFNFTKVENFGALTHCPKKDLNTKIIFDPESKEEDYQCEWFSISENGSDKYYPCGSVGVNMDKFNSTSRGFDKHPVWIFYGNSNLGKSFLSHQIKDMNVFETDAYDKLPDVINNDIVVVGNKHGYALEDVRKRINGQVITVHFNTNHKIKNKNINTN